MPPLESRGGEHAIKPFRFCLCLDQARSGHHPGFDARGHFAAVDDCGGAAQILDTPVGAGADEHLVDPHVGQLHARNEAHIVERAHRRLAAISVRKRFGIGHPTVDGQHILRAGPPAHHRQNVAGIERHLAIETGLGIGRQTAPARQRAIPILSLGRIRPAVEILERGVVGRDHARTGTRLDRHVAHRQAPFHRQARDGRAGIFDDMAGRPGRADLADDAEHHVLGGDAGMKRALHRNPHGLGFALPQRLRCQHMGNFGGADAEGQGAHRAMRGGVTVAANDGHARPAQALLRPDHMQDALTRIVDAEMRDAGARRFIGECLRHRALLGIGDGAEIAAVGWDIVIRRREGPVRGAGRQAAAAQDLERRHRTILH